MIDSTEGPCGPSRNPFGDHAVELRRAGLAVLPASGKRPLRRGFNRWTQAPSSSVVEKWSKSQPDANIVYIPGLSRTRENPHGLVVIDADDATEVERAEELFGKTPGMIDTRRGRHFLYRAPDVSLGAISSLKKFGFKIDVKHGQNGSGISVAPPSLHPEKIDFVYSWHAGSGAEALLDLPAFDVAALHAIIQKIPDGANRSDNATVTARRGGGCGTARTLGKAFPELFRGGSRKLGLNDHLAAHAWAIDDIDACLDVARAWNEDLHDRHGIDPLPEAEVLAVCKSVMADAESGKLVRMNQQRATCRSDADEVRAIMDVGGTHGSDAVALLMLLRSEHEARDRRGETFNINIDAMVENRVMGSWSARRYRRARETLEKMGLLVKTAEHHRLQHVAAKYKLSERLITPSVSARKKSTAERIDGVIEKAAKARKAPGWSSVCPISAKKLARIAR